MHSTKNNNRPKILLVGPIILDKNNSGGEGEKLYQKLKQEGYEINRRSTYRSKISRLISSMYFIVFKPRKYDVIILMLFSGKAFILEFLVTITAKLYRKQIVGVIHGGAFHHFYTHFPETTDLVFNRIDQLYSPSHFLINYFSARGHYVKYLPNFVNLDLFPLRKKKDFNYSIVWIRAFHSVYNPQLIIKAVSRLKEKYPKLQLYMAGADKGELEFCKKVAEENNIKNRVHFIGYIQNTELSDELSKHDIFVNTTSFESFGVSLIEAAACGLPIISSNVGEIPMIWNNETNILLFDDKNLEQLVQQLDKMISSEELRNKIAFNGNLIALQFQWSDITIKWNNALIKSNK